MICIYIDRSRRNLDSRLFGSDAFEKMLQGTSRTELEREYKATTITIVVESSGTAL
jgi:hypothetical protein